MQRLLVKKKKKKKSVAIIVYVEMLTGWITEGCQVIKKNSLKTSFVLN